MWVSKDRSLSVLFNAATGFDMDSDHIWDPFPKGTQPKNLKKKVVNFPIYGTQESQYPP